MSRVYLDHNATSPLRPEAKAAMLEAFDVCGNASALHTDGRAAAKYVGDGREAVGLAMGVCAQDIIFTAGGTESCNTAIHSAIAGGAKRLLISGLDHPASLLAAQRAGVKCDLIPTLPSGLADLDWLENAIKAWDAVDGRPFVSLVAANSETGVIQDAQRATEIVQSAGGHVLVDATQALGKIPMDYDADYIAVSAHKIGGPLGVGALYVSPDAPFESFMIGGGQEKRKRAGTLNAPAIAGFGAACRVCEDGVAHTAGIRDAIETGLRAMEGDLVIFGSESKRLPNTSFFAVPDKANSTLMMGLDLAGISVSTGTACASGKVGASRAVTAMGLGNQAPHGAIRVSLGYTSKPDDASYFLDAWAKIRRKHNLKGRAA